MTRGVTGDDRSIADRLQGFQEKVESCEQQHTTDHELNTPQTTLEILKRSSSEQAWEHYLSYFLDPRRQHGLDQSYLRVFIEMLQADGIIDKNLQPLYENVIIREEQSGSNSRPDILVYEPGEWFICIELKVYHSERDGQTEDHVASPTIGKLEKEDVPSAHHYYLYVAPRWAGNGEAEEFRACPWVSFDNGPSVVQAITDVVDNEGSHAPDRTLHQLQEFRETIAEELSKTMVDKRTKELKELYVEHRQDIDQVKQAFEEYADWFFDTRVPTALNGEYGPSYWNNEWIYDPYSGHTKLRRPNWHQPNGLQVHLEFYPEPKKLTEGKIHIRFDIECPSDKRWKTSDGHGPQQVFASKVLEKLDIGDLPDDIELDKKSTAYIHKLAEKHYSFSAESDEEYLEALQGGLEDMEPLVTAVDQTLEWWGENHEDLKETYSE